MTARKTTSKSTVKKAGKSSKSARIENGPLPPYGNAIKEAIGRGSLREMRNISVGTKKLLTEVNTALSELENAIGPKRK